MDPPAPRARARRWTGAVIAEAVGLSRDGGPDAGPARPGAPAGRGGPARGPALRVGTAGSLLHVDIKKLGRIAGIGHRITGDRRQRVRHGRGLSAPRRRLVRLLSEWAYAVAYPSSAHRTTVLARWLHYYNWHRAHSALNRPPISRVVGRDDLLRLHSEPAPPSRGLSSCFSAPSRPSASGSPVLRRRSRDVARAVQSRRGTAGAAAPFDTRRIADGAHTVTAAVDLSTGGTAVMNANMTVSNGRVMTNSPALKTNGERDAPLHANRSQARSVLLCQ